MSPGFRRFVAIVGGLLLAAEITYYPWSYIDHFTGDASTVYGMTMILWAPAALIMGLGTGLLFGFVMWPRKPSKPAAPEAEDKSHERSSFEA